MVCRSYSLSIHFHWRGQDLIDELRMAIALLESGSTDPTRHKGKPLVTSISNTTMQETEPMTITPPPGFEHHTVFGFPFLVGRLPADLEAMARAVSKLFGTCTLKSRTQL